MLCFDYTMGIRVINLPISFKIASLPWVNDCPSASEMTLHDIRLKYIGTYSQQKRKSCHYSWYLFYIWQCDKWHTKCVYHYRVVLYFCFLTMHWTLQWRHNGCLGVSYHQPHDCSLNYLYRYRSKKTPKLRVTGLCVGNSLVTGKFAAQMASNAENISIWWRHHEIKSYCCQKANVPITKKHDGVVKSIVHVMA